MLIQLIKAFLNVNEFTKNTGVQLLYIIIVSAWCLIFYQLTYRLLKRREL